MSNNNCEVKPEFKSGFGTFPRKTSGNTPRTKKPIVPPKPKTYTPEIIPSSRHTITCSGKGFSNYYETIPADKSRDEREEGNILYGSDVPVCKENTEENVYELIDFEPIQRTCISLEEPLYDEAVTLNSFVKKTKIKNGESIEEVSDEDEDAIYFALQKYKNQSRASWIEQIETTGVLGDLKQPLERIFSNRWNSQDNDDDDNDDKIGERPNSNEILLEVRKAIIGDIIMDEKYYADKLKNISEKSHLISSCNQSIKNDLELTLEIIASLLYIHKTFSNDLQKVLTSGCQNVGNIIETFVKEEFIQAKEYTCKYSSNIANNNWDSKFYEESLQSFSSSLSLPIWRFQNCIDYLKRLLKHTPPTHADYAYLQRSLHMAKCFFTDLSTSPNQDASLRQLVKKGLVVVQFDNERKLRHLFLFNDVIICAKQRINNKMTVQWFTPLHQLSIDDKLSVKEDQDKSTKAKTSCLKKSIIKYQAEYYKEFKNTSFIGKNKKLDALMKKLMELETGLVLNAPYLRLVLNSNRKQHIILLSSDYERAVWKNSLSSFISKAKADGTKLTLSQVSNLINDIQISPQFSRDDVFQSSRIDGQLKLTIHKFLGLQSPSKVFCTVEVDSFGHFFLVARTNKLKAVEPEWNEGFDLELEGANTLRIMCYHSDQGSDIHLGSAALELNEAWLKEKFSQESVPISKNMFIKISIEYSSSDIITSSAKLSFKSGHYFGVHLEEIARIEQSSIPLIIKSCVDEIERRGMKDTGLYRVSGLSSEIQKLKTAFNKNSTTATLSLKAADTNVLTGTIKLFLRELPDPLFPGRKYHKFIKCLHQSDESLKEQISQLPTTNLETISFLFKHLTRVSEQATFNRMTLGNLATIFGPNLMRNPSLPTNFCHEFLLTDGAADVTNQCRLILEVLNMVAGGWSFSRKER